MSDIVNFDIRPKEDTTLLTFLEYGLTEYLDKLEEIGGAAAKEHSLEKAMAKMKEEWKDMAFELVEYRDTVSFITVLVLRLMISAFHMKDLVDF